jgi:hypothetical protein
VIEAQSLDEAMKLAANCQPLSSGANEGQVPAGLPKAGR